MNDERAVPGTAEPDWVLVGAGTPLPTVDPVHRGRVFVQLIVAVVVAVAVVGVVGVIAAQRLAEAEAVSDAAKTTDLLADLIVQPELDDGLLTDDPDAVAAMDHAVRDHVLTNSSIVRVKLWDTQGRIVWSDEPRLLGRQFTLGDDEREVFTEPRVRAEVSELDAPENVYELDRGQLLETYRPVWTPSGIPMLFEVYFSYDEVSERSAALWRGFAGVTLSSLVLLVALVLPVVWRLLDRLRRGQEQREALLQRTVEASAEERRRIAGTLHDGVVQDLAATSFVVAGAAERAAATGREDLAVDLRAAADTVRSGIGGLRALLVDIYPAVLRTGGLSRALADLATGLRNRGVEVELDLRVTELDEEAERLVHRVAGECLTNIGRHARAGSVRLTLDRDGDDIVLDVVDDGIGFDPHSVLTEPQDGHFGLQVMGDLAARAGARLRVASTPSVGTHWNLRIPR